MKQKQLTYHEVLQPYRKAAFYARYSTDKQDFIMQKNAVKNFLAEYGCVFLDDHQYIDEGISAIKIPLEKRTRLQKMKNAAKNGEFDFIVIYKDDRIARDTLEHQQFRKEMNEINMPVVSASDRELYTSLDVIPRAVKDGMTRMEYVNIRERTSDTLRSKKERGEWTGGKAPFGYKYDINTKSFSLIEEEKQIVIKIFEWFKLGYGFNEIVVKIKNEWNDGIKKWSKDKVKMILTNPFYAGYITANRLENNKLTDRNQWKFARNSTIIPIISFEEWEYVMQIYEKKKSKGHNPKRFNTPFYLKDILRCQYCHSILKTKNQKKTVYTTVGDKKDYGNVFYFCDSEKCLFSLEADKIHKFFEEEILPSLLASSKDKAESKAKQELSIDRKNLVDTIVHLKEHAREHSVLISEMEIFQKEMFYKDMDDNEENALFLESLTHYQLFKQKEKDQILNQITNLEKKLMQLEKAIKYTEKALLVTPLLDVGDQVQIRRLILELDPVLYVDLDGKLHLEVNQLNN
ncbi:recombinase family protein [Gottfriedia acidiceleris]|uniref:Recombinase family protein n=1 Tax=Gottfriedia acidiceleris TaxID=371036 RepID=A0ABY4JSQ8_9BACI|nr:recombinase family protein [Gottfriedia acidiceleris]UPM56110.1 recombinase family protein [Gottfriedia acidiceleris]